MCRHKATFSEVQRRAITDRRSELLSTREGTIGTVYDHDRAVEAAAAEVGWQARGGVFTQQEADARHAPIPFIPASIHKPSSMPED